MRKLLAVAAVVAMTGSASALSITVDPVGGTAGSNPSNSIADALAQIAAGVDANNTIQLVSTAVHTQPNTQVLAVESTQTVNVVAVSGRPVIMSTAGTSGHIRLAVPSPGALNFTGIDFIPPTGVVYGNNANDYMFASATGSTASTQPSQGGVITFTDCIFSPNNGSNGPAGLVPFSASNNNFGDDLIQGRAIGLTFSNCQITGCWDDAILNGGQTTGAFTAQITLNNGTSIAEIGGAGIQVYAEGVATTLDGSGGRVQILHVGKRAGTNDTGMKFFWDSGCTVNISEADIAHCNNAAIYDFEGVPTINITDCRVADSNSSTAVPGGNVVINDISNDSAYVQTINLTRSTFHDSTGAGADGAGLRFVNDNASDPQPTWTLLDCIVSGTSDTFPMLGNAPTAVNKTFTAVVENGPDAVGSVDDLGVSALNTDPAYASYTATAGRSEANPTFLRPGNPAYYTASSTAGIIGGAPLPPAQVTGWSLY